MTLWQLLLKQLFGLFLFPVICCETGPKDESLLNKAAMLWACIFCGLANDLLATERTKFRGVFRKHKRESGNPIDKRIASV